MEYTATIEIPAKTLAYANDLLWSEFVNYSDLDIKEYETLAKWTAKFTNGMEADVKLNSNSRVDGDFYTEAVLFDKDGRQLAFTDPDDELDGTWYLYDGDDTYTVVVEKEDDEKPKKDDGGHYKLQGYRLDDTGHVKSTIITWDYYGPKVSAAKYLADAVLAELGDGDGENGGKGALSNCYGEIVQCFLNGTDYAYADCVFRLSPL